MKIFPVDKIREADNYTIEHEPILSVDLMERAARKLFNWIKNKYIKEEPFAIFAGTGNNGGDALALSRMLFHEGFRNQKVFLLRIGSSLSSDCQTNLERLKGLNGVEIIEVTKEDGLPELHFQSIAVDGIFGSGLSRPVEGYWGQIIEHINNNAAEIISIDVPSGLYVEDNRENNGSIIRASFTLTFQFPKLSFMFAENEPYVGQWFVLDIGLHPEYIQQTPTQYKYITHHDVAPLIPQRSKFGHKGTYGHAFLVAGSYQKTGAAVIAAKACMRSGVGLLTVHVPESGYEIMQTAIPEAMVCIDETEMNFCQVASIEKYNTIGVGPGIGSKKSMRHALKILLQNTKKPMVLDADALNIISEEKDLLNHVPKDSVLTPHPGEFDRLTQKHDTALSRLQTQVEFAKKHQCIIVLKGAYTSIATPNGKVYFNSTGNPGMATAGSGDALTGIILSLLAQGYKPRNAALAGVYLHGLAGDLALQKTSWEALIAHDIILNLGNAFSKTKK